jgi:uncharacterized protein (TIGR00730 family)
MKLQSLCVFCGSSPGVRPAYTDAARELGGLLAQKGVTLVYGGGNVGLMGVVADAALAAGGKVVGVIPEALAAKEVAHLGLTKLHIVKNMHERKALMADMSDGFVAMPGGFGTFEELFEVVTWSQLGFHKKPCGVLNAGGFFDPLLAMVAHAADEGFIRPAHTGILVAASAPETLLERLAAWAPPAGDKWLHRSQR